MAEVAQRIGPGLLGILDQPFVRMGLVALAAAAAIAWIASAFWCFRDARARTRDLLAPYLASGMVLLFSPALFPFALVVYVLVRPQETSHERDLRSLSRTALDSAVATYSCQACGERIDRRWVRCPACATYLSATCRRCDRALDPDWSICPWCAASTDALTPAAVAATPAAVAVTGAGAQIGMRPRPATGVAAMSTVTAVPAVPTTAVTPAALSAAAPAGLTAAPAGLTAATRALGPASMSSRARVHTSDAPPRIAVGTGADRDSQPIPMGPARGRPDRHAPPPSDQVPAPRPAASMKRLRAAREGVRTAQSLGVRRPVTGARVLQSTSPAMTASEVRTGAESSGGTSVSRATPR